LHGLTQCDTVKRARAWLTERGVGHEFHDFKKAGLAPALLDAWIAEVGWDRLLNRQGLTWKKLDADKRAGITDAAPARALMLAQPSIIKRPVVRWPDGSVTVGFDEADWAKRTS
jgi:Spx/MgsR family transcriptional regulator